MSFLTIVPKSDRRSAPGSASESNSSSSDSTKLTPVPAISDSDKSSPGILVLAPPLHLLHMNARAMELMNSHLNAGTADAPTPKVATGLLPATVLELCKDVFALLHDRSTSKDWERFEVRRFIGAPRQHLLLRGFAVPDPRGAKHSRVVVGSISMRIFSSMVTDTPIRPNNSIIVVTSCRCGTLRMVTAPSASSAPAMIGNVAFLAPEMRTSPSRGIPPLIWSLSTEQSVG